MLKFLAKRVAKDPWPLEKSVMKLTEHDYMSISCACHGAQVFGSTGSGKSTGSMAAIIRAYLLAMFGGIFFTVKPEDCAHYLRLCRKAGRARDVIVVSPQGPHRFNPLEAELSRTDAGAGNTQSVVTLLTSLIEVGERNSGSGRSDDDYWQRAMKQNLGHAVELHVRAKGTLSAQDLYRLIVSAPTSYEQLASPDWRKRSYCCECIELADRNTRDPIKRRDLEFSADYFLNEWPGLADRTRSSILSTITSMLDVLNRGTIRELTSGRSNIDLEAMQEGKIFILDFPTMVYGDMGLYLQVQFKHCTQRMQERRDVSKNSRPVFMIADESHVLAVKQDQLFQTTARSTRTAVVNATQSISNYLAAFGQHSEPFVHSLLGNLQMQFFHQQADIKTNQYAADLIGKCRQEIYSANCTHAPSDWFGSLMGSRASSATAGQSEIFEYEVQPQVFAALRKGGAPHWTVDGILYQGGRNFSQTGRPWTPVSFKQSF